MTAELKLGPGHWTDHGKDTLFAPELSKLTECGAQPLEEDSSVRDHWLADYILNTTFRYPLPDPIRQLGFALLRRVDQAITEYELGRQELNTYFTEGKPTRLTRYSRGLAHFENCVASTCHALSLGRRLIPGRPQLFTPGDGTDVQRVWELHNASKHLDERLEQGESAPDSTLHIWLANDGLKSTRTAVSFDELRLLVESLFRIAQSVANPP